MIDIKQRIIVSGLNWSGSGTVVDLLKEYDDIVQIPGGFSRLAPAGYKQYGEFSFLSRIGSAIDLIYDYSSFSNPYLPYSSDRVNSRKGLIKRILEDIYYLKLSTMLDDISVHKFTRNILKELEKILQNFAEFTHKERIKKINEWLYYIESKYPKAKKAKNVVYDQAVNIGRHDDIWREVFQPFKQIIVFRNPKDILAEQFINNYFFKRYSGYIPHIYGHDFSDIINYSVDYYKAKMNAVDKLIMHENVLLLSFEEIVLEYDTSKQKIENFLNLKSNHIKPKKFFNPDWSKNNIGIHKRVQLDYQRAQPLIDWYNSHSKHNKI